MELQPKLLEVSLPCRPEGAALVLHGGASRGANMMVSPTQLSVLRMIPIARRIARVGRRRLAVYRLLNSRRGWDTTHTPVHDVQWALSELAGILEVGTPLCLVGHSLGGRAALLAAAAPWVSSAVALAPWVYPSDVPSGLAGQRLLIVHGDSDRVASPDRSLALAQRLRGAAEVAYVKVRGGKHAMLRRHRVFTETAAQFAAATLLGSSDSGILKRIAAGERFIEV